MQGGRTMNGEHIRTCKSYLLRLGIILAIFLLFAVLYGPSVANAQWLPNGNDIYYNTGNVGIGTTTPTPNYQLDVNGNTNVSGNLHIQNGGGIRVENSSGFEFYGLGSSGFNFFSEGELIFLAGTGRRLHFGSNNVNSQVVLNNGNLGIGTETPSSKLHVVGDVTVTGNIAAKYQDVAEWVPAPAPIPVGTVVVLDADHSNHVIPSSHPYDTRVAGVVTDTPGLLLGESGPNKVKVATTGRVKVKVDADERPVHVGDLLVTSDRPGVAMRSVPIDLAGTPIHRPGTIVGKALESLPGGEGEILVLLSLQ